MDGLLCYPIFREKFKNIYNFITLPWEIERTSWLIVRLDCVKLVTCYCHFVAAPLINRKIKEDLAHPHKFKKLYHPNITTTTDANVFHFPLTHTQKIIFQKWNIPTTHKQHIIDMDLMRKAWKSCYKTLYRT